MSIPTMARAARESLGRGLEALQAADAPPGLIVVAQPLAQAMRFLVEIEAAPDTSGPSEAEPALEALREGLRLLQLPEHVQDPAAEVAMAAVAQALGAMRELTAELAPVPLRASRVATERSTPRRPVVAELGVHSATNFYKGLANGDILATGGLFVATYQLPPVGEPLSLKVSMPGGYEFEAKGIVAWTRDLSQSTSGAAGIPGFGAQLSEVSDEGRGLIQRYVRNREPLFHDDA
jgi:PilZ domain